MIKAIIKKYISIVSKLSDFPPLIFRLMLAYGNCLVFLVMIDFPIRSSYVVLKYVRKVAKIKETKKLTCALAPSSVLSSPQLR